MIFGGNPKDRRIHRIFDLESVIKCQVRNGDFGGALRNLQDALRVNPLDACYRYLQGVLLFNVGMPREAIAGLESALNLTRNADLKKQIHEAILFIEQDQVELLRVLVADDRFFRLEFQMNPVEAARRRGFELSNATEKALGVIVAADEFTRARHVQNGSC